MPQSSTAAYEPGWRRNLYLFAAVVACNEHLPSLTKPILTLPWKYLNFMEMPDILIEICNLTLSSKYRLVRLGSLRGKDLISAFSLCEHGTTRTQKQGIMKSDERNVSMKKNVRVPARKGRTTPTKTLPVTASPLLA